MDDHSDPQLLDLTTHIVSSFVAKNSVPMDTLPDLIRTVHKTLANLSETGTVSDTPPEPAVPIQKSITPDHLICLEDGRKLKLLKRYLRTRYGMTPDEYRQRWKLPADYPMVAPNYARRRSAFAKEIGLGKKTGTDG
jgi:predicted transcriptional regulator